MTGATLDERAGGCLCGAVRYAVDWPPTALVVCHCKDCQKQAGSAFSVVGVARQGAIRVNGELATFAHPGSSGQTVKRRFCGTCGSPLLTETAAARAEGIVFFKAGTLDETADLAPTVHYWMNSAQRWFAMPDGVTCLETQ